MVFVQDMGLTLSNIYVEGSKKEIEDRPVGGKP